ncbi:hypothetical protein [Lacticigenium naphthae]|uniref:hypothetical protein n=1 Tax=Lacticigenium naphthae TaxID=515351 RepID=UPI00040E4159|nr:hypothetical protein [Lacticigenium naphthae]
MISKKMKFGLLIFAFIIGGVLGFIYPTVMQGITSPIGIGVGLGYFFLSRREQKSKGKKVVTESKGFVIIQMLLAFIIGGAIISLYPLFVQTQ